MRFGRATIGLTLFMAFFLWLPGFAKADEYVERNIVMQKDGGIFYSDIIHENKPINSLVLQFNEVQKGFMVNFDPLQSDKWEDVEVHDDGFGAEAFLLTSPTRAVQFKKKAGFFEKSLTFKSTLRFQDSVDSAWKDTSMLVAGPQVAALNYKVISRRDWGADESLRYWSPEYEARQKKRYGNGERTSSDPCGDFATKFSSELGLKKVVKSDPNGEQLLWPLQYSKKIRKIVVHQTASEVRDVNGDKRTDSRDYKSMIRAIYYYHAVSRGWGDIGYNYIIDPLGNIYEGRYGGDGVVGAHTRCYNNGTIGIALLGNFEKKSVPQPALQSLINLIAKKTKIHRINPQGESVFRGRRLANILAHKDIGATADPPKNFYDLLPMIRKRAALLTRFGSVSENQINIETLDYNAEAIRIPTRVSVKPGGRSTVKLRFKNTGKKTWDQNTWLHVALNKTKGTRILPVIEDKKFVAADMKQIEVKPGQIAEFEVDIAGGYFGGDTTYEISPVVNGRFKISRSSIFLPITTLAPNFSYEVASLNVPDGNIFQGQRINAYVDLKNTGNTVWRNYGPHPITLGTVGPRDRSSILVKENPARIGYLIDSEVKPGETGRFVMDLNVPLDKEGRVIERFAPVIEGARWLGDKGLKFQASIKKPRHIAAITGKTRVSSMKPGEMRKINITFKNRGDLAWTPENMSVTLLGRGMKVFKRQLVPTKTIEPGKEGTFDFWVQAPYEAGNHTITLRPKFRSTPIRGGFTNFRVKVPKPSLRARLVNPGKRSLQVKPGEEVEVTAAFKNVGNVVWRNKGQHAIYLAPSKPKDRLSRLVYEADWPNKYRAATLNEKVVNPGEVGTFTFKVKPDKKGVYRENFQLVVERVGWLTGSNVQYLFRVFGNAVLKQPKTRIVGGVDELADSNANKKRAQNLIQKRALRNAANNKMRENKTPVITTQKSSEQKSYENVKNDSQNLRVRLSYNSDNASITADRSFKIENEKGQELYRLSAGQIVKIKRFGLNISVQAGSRSYTVKQVRFIPLTSDGVVVIKSWNHQPAWNRSLNDNKFRGIIEVREVNGSTAYINELPLEDYLKGVGEVSNTAPFEKQKAMAVLARTYARFYMQPENRKFPGLPYDASDDPDVFQKYLGYGYEKRSPKFGGAVLVTKDEVVTYKGKLIKTPYFSESDGKTLSAESVWGWKDAPYLKSVPDPYCKGPKRGHGVGLSGCGAEAMANNGSTYDDIIKYYYRGVKIEELSFN